MELAKTVEKYRRLYDEEVAMNRGKTKYDYKRKRHVTITPKCGFYSKAVREFYADMKDVSNDDPDFRRAIKVATRAFQGRAELRDPQHVLQKLLLKRGSTSSFENFEKKIPPTLFIYFQQKIQPPRLFHPPLLFSSGNLPATPIIPDSRVHLQLPMNSSVVCHPRLFRPQLSLINLRT